MPRAHFNPKAFEVSITNSVSNISRNVNNFLPIPLFFYKIETFTSYLLPIIIRKKRSNLFYLYYRSFLSNIALVIHFRWCLFTSQMHAPMHCVARLKTVSTVLNFTKWVAAKWTHTNASKIALSQLRNSYLSYEISWSLCNSYKVSKWRLYSIGAFLTAFDFEK